MHPYLLHSGHLYLPTFGALAAVGVMVALALSERTARWAGVDAEAVWNAGIFAVLAAFVLSRVLLVAGNFAMFRQFPVLLLAVPSLTPAGLLLTGVATFVWLRLRGLPLLRVLDAWAPCAAVVWMALALGHFAEGSDPGMPWRHGVIMPGDAGRTWPVALYAAAVAAVLVGVLVGGVRRGWPVGFTTGVGLAGAGVGQFLLTFLRLPGEGGWGVLDGLEWVALGMVIAGVGLLAAAGGKMRSGIPRVDGKAVEPGAPNA